jgi:nucleoside-diphosphate-sugar epimerase
MRKKAILITGASGEVGNALIRELHSAGDVTLVTVDVRPLPPDLRLLATHFEGDLLNTRLLARLVTEYEIDVIYHLAALLSTRSEHAPEAAHQVNVEGTLGLLLLAAEQSQWRNRPVQFIFPSSIAAYGLPDRETKALFQRVREFEWNQPRTMYGCNKLYCETLGAYFSRNYRQLAVQSAQTIDFRCVRFPGLISAETVPHGGTSDYAPEMIHAAAQGNPYACFVREEVRIPFMVMPDAVRALLLLAHAPQESLSRVVYNVTSFSLSAKQIRDRVLGAFPAAEITFEPDLKREAIVDSWPADVDDSAARTDWGWSPAYGADRAFNDYLIPGIMRHYQAKEALVGHA